MIDVGFLSNIFKQDYLLSCDPNGGYNIYLGVEPLITFVVSEVLLMKNIKYH